ncbi:MAG TPA: tyrosine-type recombinase/integrase [Panacibacter sp.]|nr:tyrosine-type recombinase/integrase [Panacibacter sp.]
MNKFISASKSGRRRLSNGQKISKGTITGYTMCCKLLTAFEQTQGRQLIIYTGFKTNQQHFLAQRKYWKQFAYAFADFLYKRNAFDNHVANQFKILRTFANYLYKEKGYLLNQFFPVNFISKETISIIVIRPEQLRFLINDKAFEEGLSPRLQEAKDFFVFGCTVALRVSDLLNITAKNIEVNDSGTYLVVISSKTVTSTRILLPVYAVEILKKYKAKTKFLLPRFNKSNLNIYIKQLAETAGWTNIVSKTRLQKAAPVLLYTDKKKKALHRFCDLITTHTMRRTAITTMLSLGMPEYLVRKVSGHAPGSKEFYRYVSLSQQLQDEETKRVFNFVSGNES